MGYFESAANVVEEGNAYRSFGSSANMKKKAWAKFSSRCGASR